MAHSKLAALRLWPLNKAAKYAVSYIHPGTLVCLAITQRQMHYRGFKSSFFCFPAEQLYLNGRDTSFAYQPQDSCFVIGQNARLFIFFSPFQEHNLGSKESMSKLHSEETIKIEMYYQ